MSILDDLWSWLTTSPGGSAGGTPLLGPGSPTASTQTPIIGPLQGSPQVAPTAASAPILGGGILPNQGLIAGLLGGQQPVNPMSYFTPRQGLLGNSPLGMGLRGGLAGLAAGAGVGGLSGLGAGAMGGQQEEQQRRLQQMQSVLGGQQYLSGQQALITGNINNQFALQRTNLIRQRLGQPPLTMADLIANPALAASPLPGQSVGTTAPTTTAPTTTPPAAPGQGTTVPATGGGTITIPGTTYSMPDTQRHLPSGSTATIPGQQVTIPSTQWTQFKNAITQREGGVDAISGAIGGLTRGTFNQYAKPGESFDNATDRANVADRVLNDLAVKSGGDPAKIAQGDYTGVDPARVAVGWSSGPGNIAPPGAVVPWNYDAHDGHGTTTSGFVASIARLAGQLPAQGQQPTAAPAGGGQGQQPAATGTQWQPDPNVVQSYQTAIDDALASGDITKADEYQTKLAEYQSGYGRAVQQAVATTTQTGAATFAGPQAQYDRATKLRTDYESEPAVKVYQQALPAATAFNNAYQAHGVNTNKPGPNYPGDYTLIINALKAINPDAASPRPGQAISATDLATFPAQLQKQILAFWNNQTALPGDAVDQLARAVQGQMKVYTDQRQTVTQNYRERALTDAPQVGEGYWNTDFAPPTIPDAAIKFLKANPKTARQFDIKYGLGLAQQYLGS